VLLPTQPFLPADGARNDLLVLPHGFYHSCLAPEGTLVEWLGASYRALLGDFTSKLMAAQREAGPPAAAAAEAETLTLAQIIAAEVDEGSGLINGCDSYLRLLSKTEYVHPRSNVVTEYFIRRLTGAQ
jgi:hypothetical protein